VIFFRSILVLDAWMSPTTLFKLQFCYIFVNVDKRKISQRSHRRLSSDAVWLLRTLWMETSKQDEVFEDALHHDIMPLRRRLTSAAAQLI